MAENVDKRMISDQKLDELIIEFQREREFSTEELKSTQLMVRQFASTVENTVSNLADKIEKQSEQLADQSKQVVKLFAKSEGDRENNRLIYENLIKTQEEIGAKISSIDSRTHSLEISQASMKSEHSRLVAVEERIKSVEEHSGYFKSLPKIEERLDKVESFIDEHNGEKMFKDKWWHWWSRNWWKVVGLALPASYVIVSVAEKVKSDFGG